MSLKLSLLFPLALALVTACACRGAHPTSDNGGADVYSVCSRACTKLGLAGCSAGNDPSCAAACVRDQSQGVGAQLDVACVLDAGPSREALVRCNVGACLP